MIFAPFDAAFHTGADMPALRSKPSRSPDAPAASAQPLKIRQVPRLLLFSLKKFELF
jgi:hypothetical protein